MEMWNGRAACNRLLAATGSTMWMHSIFDKGYVGTFYVKGKTEVPVPSGY